MHITVNEQEKTVTMSLEDFYKHFTSEKTSMDSIYSDPQTPKAFNLEKEITDLLSSFGIPHSIKGFKYLKEAIIYVLDEPDYMDSLVKKLYPDVAGVFDTTPQRVERAIRHAIEVACAGNGYQNLKSMFGNTIRPGQIKPTNGEFIARVSSHLELQRRCTSNEAI